MGDTQRVGERGRRSGPQLPGDHRGGVFFTCRRLVKKQPPVAFPQLPALPPTCTISRVICLRAIGLHTSRLHDAASNSCQSADLKGIGARLLVSRIKHTYFKVNFTMSHTCHESVLTESANEYQTMLMQRLHYKQAWSRETASGWLCVRSRRDGLSGPSREHDVHPPLGVKGPTGKEKKRNKNSWYEHM